MGLGSGKILIPLLGRGLTFQVSVPSDCAFNIVCSIRMFSIHTNKHVFVLAMYRCKGLPAGAWGGGEGNSLLPACPNFLSSVLDPLGGFQWSWHPLENKIKGASVHILKLWATISFHLIAHIHSSQICAKAVKFLGFYVHKDAVKLCTSTHMHWLHSLSGSQPGCKRKLELQKNAKISKLSN